MPIFLRRGSNSEGLIPLSPDRSSPIRRTSRRERSSSIRVVIFSTSSMTPDKPFALAWASARKALSGPGATVHSKQEWPDWYPPAEMLARKPELRQHMVQLQSGIGMKGGPENPLGARAMYLWSGNKDTLYRIHGTNEPWTIGTNVSSGCIRLTNEDIVDLYNRTPIGAKVIVFGIGKPATAAH